MKLTERQKNCQYCHSPFLEKVTSEGTVLRIEEDAKAKWVLKIDYPEDSGNLNNVTESIDILGCPFCWRPLNGKGN